MQEEEIRDVRLGILIHWANEASVINLLSIRKMCNSDHSWSGSQELDHMFGKQKQTCYQDYQ